MIEHAASDASAVPHAADVVVIGDGVIGLSTALELARAGARCIVLGAGQPGAASGAAAGLLAPSIGTLAAAVRPFFFESLERFPAFLDSIRAFDPTLEIVRGLLDVSHDAADASADQPGHSLTRSEARVLEPMLDAPYGARFHPSDGAIDIVRLGTALASAVASRPDVHLGRHQPAIAIDRSANEVGVRLANGERIRTGRVVVAAGAWSPMLDGLPRSLPVFPLKGQMLALRAAGLTHPVMSDGVYLVPRGTEIAIGATAEHAGFDLGTNSQTIERMRLEACAVCPSLAEAPVIRQWAGIRPATPDMLPILGPDPDDARIIYACGHSKNGILLAPATAVAIGAVAQGRHSSADLAPFSITRFAPA